MNTYSQVTEQQETDSHGKDVKCISSGSRHLKVGLQDVDSSGEGFMTAATEQGDSGVEQDGGDQGGIGDASQALNTALKTPCGGPTGTR